MGPCPPKVRRKSGEAAIGIAPGGPHRCPGQEEWPERRKRTSSALRLEVARVTVGNGCSGDGLGRPKYDGLQGLRMP
ncbi:hypothetical protein NDU88_008293 [Pleurodeles waltl]|uniref:Uncharacterized protein n=1 Tax=Pleurodeles waltl TaxID=8319 RepID=A0AAV7RRX2_PLEWA|nr:hypothetical protein NDU88_008293 [Pleurodeles waltl]